MMKKNLSILFSIIILSAVIGLGVRFVFAQIGWYEPTDAPPIDNEIPLWIRVGNDMYHTTGGNVGIGTTSPASKLEVVNSSSASDVYGIKTAASSTYGGYERIYGIYSSATASPTSGGDTTIGVYGLASSTRGSPIGVYGAGGIRGRGVQGSGKVGVYGYAYGIAGGTGVFAWGDTFGLETFGDTAIYAGGNTYGIFSDSGKNYFADSVGIGTTSPGAKLDVEGDMRTNGDIILGPNHSAYFDAVFKPVSDWANKISINYGQNDPDNHWAAEQTASWTADGIIDSIKVYGNSDDGGYCYAYWGTGNVAGYQHSGGAGYYNVDDKYYSGFRGGPLCPTRPPSFDNNGNVKICQLSINCCGGFPLGNKEASGLNLSKGTKIYVKARHVIGQSSDWVQCYMDVRYKRPW